MSSSPENSTASIGIPQLILCAVVIAIVYRYVISSPSTGSGSAYRINRHVPPETITAVQSMFPQVSVAAIRYDLERNGGSLEATTEKILAEGTLPEPPGSPVTRPSHSQTPQRPPSQNPPVSRTVQARTTASASSAAPHADLITHYNLHSRLLAYKVGDAPVVDADTASKKNDKASLFIRGHERRDVMILEARRKMEEMLS